MNTDVLWKIQLKKIFVSLTNNVCYCLDNFYFITCMITAIVWYTSGCLTYNMCYCWVTLGKLKYEVCYCLNSLHMMTLLFVCASEKLTYNVRYRPLKLENLGDRHGQNQRATLVGVPSLTDHLYCVTCHIDLCNLLTGMQFCF